MCSAANNFLTDQKLTAIHFPAIAPDLPISPCQGANISHIYHRLCKTCEECVLTTRIAVRS